MDQNFPSSYYTVGIKLRDYSVGQAIEFLIESFKEKIETMNCNSMIIHKYNLSSLKL